MNFLSGKIKPIFLRINNPRRLALACLLCASWAYLAAAFLLANLYGVYPVHQMRRVLLAAVVLLILLPSAWLAIHRLVFPILDRLSRRQLDSLLLISAALGVLLLAFLPIPQPMLAHTGRLKIVSIGEMNPAGRGSSVEIRDLRDFSGKPLPVKEFKVGGDWQVGKDKLLSAGSQPGSVAVFDGQAAGGILFSLHYYGKAGKVQVSWNGRTQTYDLFTQQADEFRPGSLTFSFQDYPPGLKAVLVAALLLHFLALSGLVFLLAAVSVLSDRRRWRWVSIGLCLGIFAGFAAIKLSYQGFDAPLVFRDTTSYVAAAGSGSFLFGQRSFTLPLAYKLLGVTLANYEQPSVMQRTAAFQIGFSIVCWAALALAFARSLNRRWLVPIAFGVILFFSLGLEISLWDPLMLSESLSFSLFALLLACWIFFETLPENLRRNRWMLGSCFSFTLLVSVLYSFTRDTNLYFLLLLALGLALVSVIRIYHQGHQGHQGTQSAFKLNLRAPSWSSFTLWLSSFLNPKDTGPQPQGNQPARYFYLSYLVFALLLFIFQTASVQVGDRWQVLLYDHLALRILPDPQAAEYFRRAGLPVTPDLLKIQTMRGAVYQNYLFTDPEMEPVRQWVDQHGKAAFLGYLLTHPAVSLLEPLEQAGRLLDGSVLSYRNPVAPDSVVPELVLALTRKTYPHEAPLLLTLVGFVLLAFVLAWRRSRQMPPAAWLILLLLVSLPTLMLIVWNGNPMEIERHAAQLGIQLRLAGWMGAVLAVDSLTHP
jgi:hypothetical protein